MTHPSLVRPSLTRDGTPLELMDRVAYCGAFLRSTGCHELAFRRGYVIETGGVLVRVEWDGGPTCGAPVLARNLVHVARIPLELV